MKFLLLVTLFSLSAFAYSQVETSRTVLMCENAPISYIPVHMIPEVEVHSGDRNKIIEQYISVISKEDDRLKSFLQSESKRILSSPMKESSVGELRRIQDCALPMIFHRSTNGTISIQKKLFEELPLKAQALAIVDLALDRLEDGHAKSKAEYDRLMKELTSPTFALKDIINNPGLCEDKLEEAKKIEEEINRLHPLLKDHAYSNKQAEMYYSLRDRMKRGSEAGITLKRLEHYQVKIDSRFVF